MDSFITETVHVPPMQFQNWYREVLADQLEAEASHLGATNTLDRTWVGLFDYQIQPDEETIDCQPVRSLMAKVELATQSSLSCQISGEIWGPCSIQSIALIRNGRILMSSTFPVVHIEANDCWELRKTGLVNESGQFYIEFGVD
jgi:hypothetical protein